MSLAGIFRPGMRGYFVPFGAGLVLAVSSFLPWVIVDEVVLRGVPDAAGLWVAGLGIAAAVLAFLSLWTRRNSRHPILIVGLAALAITFLSWRIMPRLAGDRALTISQAEAIVSGGDASAAHPVARAAFGLYVGVGASVVLVCFGLTIVIKRAKTAYVVVDPDDDVE